MFALTPGRPVGIAEGVWRLLALNPGMMSGPGTNTYLLEARDGLWVIDPGPEDERHLANILAAADEIGRPVTRVLVTHTHRDHSPCAHQLVARTGAVLLGPAAVDDNLQDERWQVTDPLTEGVRLDLGHDTLRVLATPGHVSNHLCYLLEGRRMLFSGDHIINGSTVVIAPPAGSMSAYLTSLQRLLDEPLEVIAPGHGDLLHTPYQSIEQLIGHRLKREQRVRDALARHPGSTAAELVGEVYEDVPAFLHPVAEYSLLAHLIKLVEDGVAMERERRFTLRG